MKDSAVSTGARRWLDAFRAAKGRAPRVLHIGNIANNAYNNAKLMRAAGLDCDVLCYDYYHVMGCPEWEDADFDVSPADQFYPDWASVDLRGYERPKWFVQGPDMLCIRYLLARRRGEDERARRLWDALSLTNRTRGLHGIDRAWPGKLWLLALIAAAKVARWYSVVVHHPDPRSRVTFRLDPLRERWGSAVASMAEGICSFGVMLVRAIDAGFGMLRGTDGQFRTTVADLTERFRAEFPGRRDQLSIADLWHYERLQARLRDLFSHYDFVQAYATDPILPLLCGKAYFAFEHGTLREIPAREAAEGRITLLAYRYARHVFVTNHDCLDMARYLAGERVSFINHPYDEDHALEVPGWEEERRGLERATDASFLFFFPTRQDWSGGKKTAEKGNDVFLRAFCELRRRGNRVGMVGCEWGLDLSDSKKLLDELGCSRYVRWLPPMGIVRFSRFARACHVVVDQFKLGAFGGVVFKALAVGAPVLTYLDEAAIGKLYKDPPPVINCRTSEKIVEAIESLIGQPDRLASLSGASRRWVKQYHAASQTVDAQLAVYGAAWS